jgi:long-chain acyl-CoA synthetase
LDQVIVIGERRPYLVGLVALDANKTERLLDDVAALSKFTTQHFLANPNIIDLVRKEIVRLGQRLAPYERLSKVAILTEPISIERGEVTPTLKLRRSAIAERHAALIEELYRATNGNECDVMSAGAQS